MVYSLELAWVTFSNTGMILSPDARSPWIRFIPIKVLHPAAAVEEDGAGVAALEGFVKCAVVGDEGAAVEVIEHVEPRFATAAAAADVGGLAIHVDDLVLGHADAGRAGAFLLIARGRFPMPLRARRFTAGSGLSAAVGFGSTCSEESGGEGEKEGGFHGR